MYHVLLQGEKAYMIDNEGWSNMT